MELRALRYFCLAAEEENLRLAAERLHVSQSVVTRRIQDLEAGLGVSLFKRSRRRIRLSPAGRALSDRVQKPFAELEDVSKCVQEAAEGLHGKLGIGIQPSVMRHRAFQEHSRPLH